MNKPLIFAVALLWLVSLAGTFYLTTSFKNAELSEVRAEMEHLVLEQREVIIQPPQYIPIESIAEREIADLREHGVLLVEQSDPAPRRSLSRLKLPLEDEAGNLLPASPAELRKVLGGALVSQDLVSRNLAIGNMLARLSPENVGEALRLFEDTPASFHTDNNFRLFLHAWAKLDGKAALAYIMENPDGRKVKGEQAWAMSGWTATDPAAAMAFIERLEVDNEGKVDRGLYQGLVRGLARHNLEHASGYVRDLENHETRHWMTDVLIESSLEQRGAEASMAWTSQLLDLNGEDGRFGYAVLEDAIRQVSRQDAAAVAEWMSSNRDSELVKPWMFRHTAHELGQDDIHAAARWVEDNSQDPRVDASVVGQVVRDWSRDDAAAAAGWLETFRDDPTIFNQGATEGLARTWSRQDPNAAFEWADTLDSDTRRNAYANIVGHMPKEDFAVATGWIESAPVDSVMDGARAAYAHRLAEENPQAALAEAFKMTDALGRERTVVAVAQNMYRKNPEAIRLWLPVSGLTESAQQRVVRQQRR